MPDTHATHEGNAAMTMNIGVRDMRATILFQDFFWAAPISSRNQDGNNLSTFSSELGVANEHDHDSRRILHHQSRRHHPASSETFADTECGHSSSSAPIVTFDHRGRNLWCMGPDVS
jgi:hypothetical protein